MVTYRYAPIGLYLVSFGMCIYALLFSNRPPSRWLLLIALSLFIVATVDEMLQFVHVLNAFVWSRNAIDELSDISYWVNGTKALTFTLQVMIGDGILVGFQVPGGNP